MARIFANEEIDMSSAGGITSVAYDDFYLLSSSNFGLSFRYTLRSFPVMDVSIGGNFYASSYDVSGNLNSLSATRPGGSLIVSIEGLNLSFGSAYVLSNQITSSSMMSRADQIFGSSASDKLYGYNGNDVIAGNGGNDIIDGGSGFDTIDGGDGVDVAIRTMPYSSSALVSYGGQVAVMDRFYGTDLLANVEYVRFSSGLVPTASAAGFDALGYVAANRDLAAIFGTNGAAAFNHYISTGYSENRSTSFDALSYLAANADVATYFGPNAAAATLHYITSGRTEGRSTSFSAMSYMAANPDLIAAFGTNATAATQHFITSGRLEGRPTTFNAAAYLARNPDVRRALGSSEQAAAAHYVISGYREGRSALPLATTTRAGDAGLASSGP